MQRPSNGERYLEIIDDFRRRVPGITMRSTFIVGFPGETEEHVDDLEAWIARAELDRVGFFIYSREDGTPGADLPDQVPEREKRRRLVRLRDAQRLASERARARRIGTTVRVLVEERRRCAGPTRSRSPCDARVYVGRSMGEAPGVDGGISFADDGRDRGPSSTCGWTAPARSTSTGRVRARCRREPQRRGRPAPAPPGPASARGAAAPPRGGDRRDGRRAADRAGRRAGAARRAARLGRDQDDAR